MSRVNDDKLIYWELGNLGRQHRHPFPQYQVTSCFSLLLETNKGQLFRFIYIIIILTKIRGGRGGIDTQFVSCINFKVTMIKLLLMHLGVDKIYLPLFNWPCGPLKTKDTWITAACTCTRGFRWFLIMLQPIKQSTIQNTHARYSKISSKQRSQIMVPRTALLTNIKTYCFQRKETKEMSQQSPNII